MVSVGEAGSARAAASERYAPSLPDHLKQFVVDQGYERYTPVDHAVWRYIMRQNLDYLALCLFSQQQLMLPLGCSCCGPRLDPDL